MVAAAAAVLAPAEQRIETMPSFARSSVHLFSHVKLGFSPPKGLGNGRRRNTAICCRLGLAIPGLHMRTRYLSNCTQMGPHAELADRTVRETS